MSVNRRSALLMSTALQATVALVLATPAMAQPAPNARPTGGAVVAGSAAISQTASNTAINQSSQRAAVNWKSFNVGSQQSVTFNQPSASAMTLNRVTGPDPSQIAGRIDANGQIVLVNQSGVTFYKGAQVNVNGLMVTAAGISNRNFMAGAMIFDQPGNPNARIDNQGSITVRQAGLAALVAPQVANSGVITAKLGHVVLAGAKTATLDLYGDGLLSLDVSNQVTQAPAGATALVTNTGVIIADGGTVQLTARAADGIVQNLVQAGGRIRAATVGGQTGTVALNGVGGSIVVEGQLAAPGYAPGAAGGSVEVASDGNVTLASTARINVSGKAGGGTVAIGTTLARAKGGPGVTPTVTAKNVAMQAGATIADDAITNGDGGHVTVLSSNNTQMDGLIIAKGGTQSGNGGFVEVSGDTLGMTGSVDLSAPNGTLGTLLLDPIFLNIISGPPPSGSEDGNFLTNFGTVFASDGGTLTPDTISNGIINGTSASVLLQALNTLTVAANINLTLSGQNLTLEAGGTLTINSGFAVSANGDIILATGGAGPSSPPPGLPAPLISISGAVTSGGTISLLSGTGGTINLGTGGTVSAATIALNSGIGGVALTGSAALGTPGGSVDVTSTGPVGEAPGSIITTGTLGSSGGVAGTASLLGTGNAINVVTGFPVTGGDLTVVDHSNLTLAGTQSANNLFFEVANPGGILLLGSLRPPAQATLLAGTGGRISLVADNYAVVNAKSSVTTSAGAIELAPFSALATSILSGSGLLVDPAMLSIVQTGGGTLDVGGFTNVPAGATTPAASASSVNVGGAFNLTSSASTLRLDATGGITQSGGPITVGNLEGTGAAWTLTNAGNAIGTLGNVTATSLALADSTNLSVNGTVAAGVDATITDPAALTIATGGTLTATAIGLTAGNIDIAGLLSDGGAGTTSLVATAGTITDIGTLIAGTLSGGSVGATDLPGSTPATNHIATLGNFSAAGFALSDGTSLDVTGTVVGGTTVAIADQIGALTIGGAVTATAISLVGDSMAIPGLVSDGPAGTVLLIATTGGITATGTLIAGTLSSASPGATALTGPNQIAGLGVVSASSFTMNDTTNLLITGPVVAPNILISAATSQITLGNTGTIATGGTLRPPGPIQPALEPANGAPGAYLQAANFVQSGLSTVLGTSGGPATLQISVTGSALFASSGPTSGLAATGSWLILDLGSGSAAGNVFVNALDVSYTVSGSANLTGTIAGIAGGPAAAVGFIEPAINGNYLFNGCIIEAATCGSPVPPTPIPPPTPIVSVSLPTLPPPALILPPIAGIPAGAQTSALGGLYPFLSGGPPPLINLPNLVIVALPMLPAAAPRLTDPDVVPPNISYLDY